jgi:hypothetical protein
VSQTGGDIDRSAPGARQEKWLRVAPVRAALVLLIALTFVLAAFPVIGSAWCFVCAAAWVGTGVLWLSWLIARPRLKFESGQVSPATRDAAKPSLGVRLMPHLYPGWRSFTASALVLTFFAAGRSVPGYYV